MGGGALRQHRCVHVCAFQGLSKNATGLAAQAPHPQLRSLGGLTTAPLRSRCVRVCALQGPFKNSTGLAARAPHRLRDHGLVDPGLLQVQSSEGSAPTPKTPLTPPMSSTG